MYFIFIEAHNGDKYFKFGDVVKVTNYSKRLSQYRTHNPLISEENFLQLPWHGNTDQSKTATVVKNSIAENVTGKLGAHQCGNTEWFTTTNASLYQRIVTKVQEIAISKEVPGKVKIESFQGLIKWFEAGAKD